MSCVAENYVKKYNRKYIRILIIFNKNIKGTKSAFYNYILAAAIIDKLNISSLVALFSATCTGAEKPCVTFAHTLKPPNNVNDFIAVSAD